MSGYLPNSETNRYDDEPSAVSWSAVFAGALAAAALSLIMLILGAGLGLSVVSPWSLSGISAGTFGVAAIAWITFTQLVASGMGGYMAGRLRTKWVSVHTDEVYFRDTAHGFLAWAAASLVTAAVLASATGAILGSGVQAGATVASTVVSGAAGAAGMAAAKAGSLESSSSDVSAYFIDALFRKDVAASAASGGTPTLAVDVVTGSAPAAEIGRIYINSLRSGSMAAEDTRYVGQLVSLRTGLAQVDAEKRVSDSFTRLQTKLKEAETAAKDAADKARKASAYAALWVFISLLAGAFVASLAATFGGRQRDVQMPAVVRFQPVN